MTKIERLVCGSISNKVKPKVWGPRGNKVILFMFTEVAPVPPYSPLSFRDWLDKIFIYKIEDDRVYTGC